MMLMLVSLLARESQGGDSLHHDCYSNRPKYRTSSHPNLIAVPITTVTAVARAISQRRFSVIVARLRARGDRMIGEPLLYCREIQTLPLNIFIF